MSRHDKVLVAGSIILALLLASVYMYDSVTYWAKAVQP